MWDTLTLPSTVVPAIYRCAHGAARPVVVGDRVAWACPCGDVEVTSTPASCPAAGRP